MTDWDNTDQRSSQIRFCHSHTRFIIDSTYSTILTFTTGDRATRDKDGYLYFVGRSDDVILSAGLVPNSRCYREYICLKTSFLVHVFRFTNHLNKDSLFHQTIILRLGH